MNAGKTIQGKLTHCALLAIFLPALTGCLGPRGLSVTRKRYNQAIVRTNAEETLLNVVRLRYLEQVLSLPVSGVTSQFELSTGADLLNGQDAGDPTNLFGARGSFADRPTVVFNPSASDELSKLFYGRLKKEEVDTLLDSFEAEKVFRLFISQVNGLDNASSGEGPTPLNAPQYANFRHVARLFTQLQRQQAVLFPLEKRRVDLEDTVPIKKLTTQDIINLKKAGYGIRKEQTTRRSTG